MQSTTDPNRLSAELKHAGRLARTLDLAASIVTIVAGIGVITLAATLYSRQTAAPTQVVRALAKEAISIESAARQGSETAPEILVVFSDYQCPFCRIFARNVLPQVISRFVATGKVQLAYLHFPLTTIHPLAMRAAREAHCAQVQGRYWEMHEALFQDAELTDVDLDTFPSAIGLDPEEFDQCMGDPKTAAAIGRDVALGKAIALQGTPTFVVGLRSGPASLEAVRRFGAKTFEQVALQLDDVAKAARARN